MVKLNDAMDQLKAQGVLPSSYFEDDTGEWPSSEEKKAREALATVRQRPQPTREEVPAFDPMSALAQLAAEATSERDSRSPSLEGTSSASIKQEVLPCVRRLHSGDAEAPEEGRKRARAEEEVEEESRETLAQAKRSKGMRQLSHDGVNGVDPMSIEALLQGIVTAARG